MSDEELDELLDQFDEYFYTPGGDEDEDQEDIDDENDR